MSFIIQNNRVVAVTTNFEHSRNCVFSTACYERNHEEINRFSKNHYDLINPRPAKISNAKKWARHSCGVLATNLSRDYPEFIIYLKSKRGGWAIRKR